MATFSTSIEPGDTMRGHYHPHVSQPRTFPGASSVYSGEMESLVDNPTTEFIHKADELQTDSFFPTPPWTVYDSDSINISETNHKEMMQWPAPFAGQKVQRLSVREFSAGAVSDATDADKKEDRIPSRQKRRTQNRLAQRAFRDRKRRLFDDLLARHEELQQTHENICKAYESSLVTLSELKAALSSLVEKL